MSAFGRGSAAMVASAQAARRRCRGGAVAPTPRVSFAITHVRGHGVITDIPDSAYHV